MSYRRSQTDVAHALAPDFRARDFHSAAVTDHAAVADALVLAAETLPVLGRAEESFTKQSVFFWAQRTVVDGLRLGYFTVRPIEYLFGGRNGDADRIEVSPLCIRPI